MTDVSAFAAWLRESMPYGILVITAYALWSILNKKDAELKALNERVAEMAEAQTAAMVKMEAALDGLADVIKNLPGARRRTDQ